jgi:two-component system, chemotaxis family, protein-glutamate methylesterase/glutaminase
MPVLPPIRVLVVDDSMVVRKVLSDILASSPGIDLAGTASSGEIALVKIPQLKPDVVTLDIEMPGMSGLQTFLSRSWWCSICRPCLPICWLSIWTEKPSSLCARRAQAYRWNPATSGSLPATITCFCIATRISSGSA